MGVRVPAVVTRVLDENPDYEHSIAEALRELRDALKTNQLLPALLRGVPHATTWQRALAEREGERWLATDWFFSETYLYRQLIDRVGFWESRRDPFLPTKREEYRSPAHAEALERALAVEGSLEQRLHSLFALCLFGNRIDLSFAASLERGMAIDARDLIADEREAAVRAAVAGKGPLHVVVDNAGTELTLDLVLADFALRELECEVILHLKIHPTFVSDATEADVRSFLGAGGEPSAFEPRTPDARSLIARLADAVRRGRLVLAPHPCWNEPESLWDLRPDLEARLAGARLVVLKGDANYRRAVGDAIWPPEMPFDAVTAYFPAPLLALRTLKSDPIAGLAPGLAPALDGEDPSWRVNGKRGVASFGGARSADSA